MQDGCIFLWRSLLCYNRTMRTVDLIAKKRDGGALSPDEIAFLIGGYVRGDVPDYQMSAWLMAVLWRGLTDPETFALTGAMVASGGTLDLSSLPGVPVDKHSTGGVGDKTTLAVVPILASAGVPVAKMSGRGLGHTGGTLDKLAAIPGLRAELSTNEILSQVRRVGACICAQTEQLVPADRKMYALRDATSTVESLPLIAASIMSKKIAGGSRAVVLDVKVGGGAFMKTRDQARALADLMVKIGQAHGQRIAAVLSDMDAPLGRNVGNWLEVQEIIGLLQNDPDTEPRLARMVRYLAALGFVLAGRTRNVTEGEALASRQIESGAAFETLCEIAAAQGGDTACLRTPGVVEQAPSRDVLAPQSGFVTRIDAQAVGLAAMRLGAGRAVKDDTIDPLAGIVLRVPVGGGVARGGVIATLYTNNVDAAPQAAEEVAQTFTFAPRPPPDVSLIYETVGLTAQTGTGHCRG